MLRILLAEGDAEVRELILGWLRSDNDIQIVGMSDDGPGAVAMTKRLRPDLVLMDVGLRTFDGLRATSEIMIEAPTPIVLVSGARDGDAADLSLRALRAGALSLVSVPDRGDEHFLRKRGAFLATIKALAEVKVVRRWRDRTSARVTSPARLGEPCPPLIVAIAASTGGPAALESILVQLPRDFQPPILVVQHIAVGFLEGVATWLDEICRLHVKVAQHGERLVAGTVYFAPDERHLGVARTGRITLSREGPIGGFRPSATHLFESVARSFGRNALAIILSGMGRDGVVGLRAVREHGGRVIAQDEASCVVFGMPKAAIEENLVDEVLPAVEIGRLLVGAAKNGGRS